MIQRPIVVFEKRAPRYFYIVNGQVIDSTSTNPPTSPLKWKFSNVYFAAYGIPFQHKLVEFPVCLLVKGAYVHKNVMVSNENVPEFFDITLIKFRHGIAEETSTIHIDGDFVRGDFEGMRRCRYDAVIFADIRHGRDLFYATNVPWFGGFRTKNVMGMTYNIVGVPDCGTAHLVRNCSKCNILKVCNASTVSVFPLEVLPVNQRSPSLLVTGESPCFEMHLKPTEETREYEIEEQVFTQPKLGPNWEEFSRAIEYTRYLEQEKARRYLEQEKIRRMRNGPPYRYQPYSGYRQR